MIPTLRPWNLQDLDQLVLFANNWNIAKNLTDQFPNPYTRTHGMAFIEYANLESPVHIFAIDVNGIAIGGIGIHPQKDIYQKNAELGYWLAEPYWGKGLATAAIKLIVQFAFEHFDIERIYARPFGPNIASQRILEKNGFKLEAKLVKVFFKKGEFLDELIYGLRRKDWKKF